MPHLTKELFIRTYVGERKPSAFNAVEVAQRLATQFNGDKKAYLEACKAQGVLLMTAEVQFKIWKAKHGN